MTRRIYRKITSILLLEKFNTLTLECGHKIIDNLKNNNIKVGFRFSCRQCLSDFETLEMFVTNEDE